jgi:hypothetical protein
LFANIRAGRENLKHKGRLSFLSCFILPLRGGDLLILITLFACYEPLWVFYSCGKNPTHIVRQLTKKRNPAMIESEQLEYWVLPPASAGASRIYFPPFGRGGRKQFFRRLRRGLVIYIPALRAGWAQAVFSPPPAAAGASRIYSRPSGGVDASSFFLLRQGRRELVIYISRPSGGGQAVFSAASGGVG